MSCVLVFSLVFFPQIFYSLSVMSHASRQIHGPCQVVVGLDDDFLSSPEARAINKNQTFVSWQNTCVKREVKKRHLKGL